MTPPPRASAVATASVLLIVLLFLGTAAWMMLAIMPACHRWIKEVNRRRRVRRAYLRHHNKEGDGQ